MSATTTSKPIFGMWYTPCAMVRVEPIASVPPNPPYAPASPITRQRMPVIVPSRLSPSSTYWTCERPCDIPTMFSERDSTHRMGRFSSHDTRAAICASAHQCLAPNEPPTCGAITRSAFMSTPMMPATSIFTMCGIWHARCSVTSCPRPSSPGTTAHAEPSIGTTATRWFTNRPRTITSASSSGSPGLPRLPPQTLDPRSSNSSGAPGASASSRSMTAGSGS